MINSLRVTLAFHKLSFLTHIYSFIKKLSENKLFKIAKAKKRKKINVKNS